MPAFSPASARFARRFIYPLFRRDVHVLLHVCLHTHDIQRVSVAVYRGLRSFIYTAIFKGLFIDRPPRPIHNIDTVMLNRQSLLLDLHRTLHLGA